MIAVEPARDLSGRVAIVGVGETDYDVDHGRGRATDPSYTPPDAQALHMAGVTLDDVDSFQGYDASSIHLINQVEGYGFVAPRDGLELCKEGNMALISWCTFERKYYGDLLPIPWDTILVELQEGPLFISDPKGSRYRDVVPDMPVRVAFIECEDGAGPFRLPVFEKA